MEKSLIIGVAGGTGSGKTTLALSLYKAFSPDCVLLSHDFYYKSRPDLTFEERCKQNYDHPNSLETDLFVKQLKELSCGKSICQPTYDFEHHIRSDKTINVDPHKIIIVEGILLFENRELCDLCDIKLFVDTDADVRFIRRLRRDTAKRGRSMQSVMDQYLATVKPMHDRFIEPSKRNADVIIPEGGKNKVAINMIIDSIKKKQGYLD